MIEEYVREIRSAISNHLYYPALALALTLPDVCGNVEYPESSVFDRYTKWYDECVGLFLQEDRIPRDWQRDIHSQQL